MTDPSLSFFARLVLAFVAFVRILSNARFAALVDGARREGAAPTPAPALPPVAASPASPAPPESKVHAVDPRAAMQLLGLLQREGRLLDFVTEDMSGFSDAELGAAARVVHDGCKKALAEHVELVPVRPEAEGTRIVLEAGFDPASIRLTGRVSGAAPHTGTLQHRGYRVASITLPKLHDAHDARVLQAAEVEL